MVVEVVDRCYWTWVEKEDAPPGPKCTEAGI